MDMFDEPSTGARITDFAGCLLLVTPTEYRDEVMTVRGPTDAVVADLTVLDGDHAGETHPGTMIFQKVLKGQLRGKVGTGRSVLGRLMQGSAKPGQSAPWILASPTDADKNTARTHTHTPTVEGPVDTTAALAGLSPLQQQAIRAAASGGMPF